MVVNALHGNQHLVVVIAAVFFGLVLVRNYSSVYRIHYLLVCIFCIELALLVPGISACGIYEQLGLLNEMLRSWTEALSNYSKGILYALNKEELDNLEDAVKRTRFKMEKTLKYSYQVL